MNQLLDQFFALESRERKAACGLVLLLVLGGYWYLVYADRRAETAVVSARVEELRGQLESKQKLLATITDRREAVQELQAQVRRAEAQLPDRKEIPDLLSSVSSAGRESGLEILLFRQNSERLKEYYAEVPVEVRVSGGYHQVATFFDRVGQLDRIVNVSDISMKSPKLVDGSLMVETTCSAVTFRFLDEAERERVAKEKAEKAKGKKAASS